MAYDVQAIRKDFPILSREVYGKPEIDEREPRRAAGLGRLEREHDGGHVEFGQVLVHALMG